MSAGIENQPVSNVVWVDRDEVTANDYNPNYVAPLERKLLRKSILEDGWTQPIVLRSDNEIVDGYHRWLLAAEPGIAALTDNKIPVVYLSVDDDMAHQIMSTLRHNRARGQHTVLKMADVVARLVDDENVPWDELQDRLGMEWEEVDRLYDRGKMTDRGSQAEFSKGWVPDGKIEVATAEEETDRG